MKLVCVISFLLLLSGLRSCASQSAAYDHSSLALTWPPAMCELAAGTNTPCTRTPEEKFTIHGLWPANQAGNSVNVPVLNCADSLRWMDSTTSPLVQELNIYWPDFKFTPNKGLWIHEWRNHGCMQCVFLPEEYFEKTLSMRKMAGSIVTALESQGVKPSNTSYELSKFVDALKQATGVDRVVLICVQGLLLEVRICVNRNANKFIDCTANAMTKSCTRRTLKLPAAPAQLYDGGIIKALNRTSDANSTYAGI